MISDPPDPQGVLVELKYKRLNIRSYESACRLMLCHSLQVSSPEFRIFKSQLGCWFSFQMGMEGKVSPLDHHLEREDVVLGFDELWISCDISSVNDVKDWMGSFPTSTSRGRRVFFLPCD